MYEYFRENFFLEVQYHNTDSQKELNKRILLLSDKYNIPIVMGCDSHYIDESTSWERDDYILSKGIRYDDEQGWLLDYCTGDNAKERFINQGILNDNQISQAINNTNVFLDVCEYNSPCFTFDVKMPILPKYQNNTQKEREEIFKNIIWNAWEKEKKKISQDKWKLYESEIEKEIEIVIATKQADYFLLDYELVKKSKEMGGMITPSGRGSAVSFYINKLLGFTMVDRISADVKMYPERFMSTTRILEAKTLVDIDINAGNPEVFAQAQSEILGLEHSYPMLAYGTYRPKAAWKLYAKAQGIDFELANEVSDQIEKYEKALKYANSEEDREEIDVLDYIDIQYREIFEKSKKYQGIIADWKIAPCGFLIYQGNIKREIGLIKIKDNLCCLMDGKWAEDYKFLKNDLLKVSVVKLIYQICNRIGIKLFEEKELLELCPPDSKVWDIYKTGATLGINQVEQYGTRARAMVYRPVNISELCAFVAAIRPGFKSMYKIFENREDFSYGIDTLDNLIQTEQFPQSFMLYQEQQMAVLNFAGIPMVECYEIIKNIAKKRAEKVLKYKDIFLTGFKNKMMQDENKSETESNELANKIWQILEDSASYSFNASHSYCVSIDSLYAAYLKTKYPLYFYEVFLNLLEEGGEKDRMVATKSEAESYFKIKFPPMRFRQDNRKITANESDNTITMSLQSIKNMSKIVAEQLYKLRNNNYDGSFIKLLYDLKNKTSINMRQLNILTQIGYWGNEFANGNIRKLLMIIDTFNFMKKGAMLTITKSKIPDHMFDIIAKNANNIGKDGKELQTYRIADINTILCELELKIIESDVRDISLHQRVENEMQYVGSISGSGDESERAYLYIQEVFELKTKADNRHFGFSINFTSLGSGKQGRMSIMLPIWKKYGEINVGDIIYCDQYKKSGQYFHIIKYRHIN